MYVRGLLVLLFVAGFIGAAHAQDINLRSAAGQSIASLQAKKRLRTPSERKMTSQLLDASGVAKQLAKAGDLAAFEPVTIDIRADVTSELLLRIENMGGTVISSISKVSGHSCPTAAFRHRVACRV